MIRKIVFIFIAAALCIVVLTVYLKNSQHKGTSSSRKINVITTLFPLYDFARNVGQDRVEVTLLLPPGVEAHSFEPKPSDIVKINEADVFVYTGRFMEPWANDIAKGVTNKNLIIVDASQGTKMTPGVFHDVDEPAGALDPHIWLDFDNAGIMVDNITQSLETKDAEHKDIFKKNSDRYKNSLRELDDAFKNALSKCRGKEIVYGGHFAFGYLAHRYGLRYLAAQGVSPDAEPTANDLARLVEQMRKDNIKYVFYEELSSPKIALTIANETNAQMLMLNAAHNVTKDQVAKGTTFIDILNFDLENLKVGLGCH
jgi:zinc transport system substrate-binding protein